MHSRGKAGASNFLLKPSSSFPAGMADDVTICVPGKQAFHSATNYCSEYPDEMSELVEVCELLRTVPGPALIQ